MKILRKALSVILVLTAVMVFSNIKCLAADTTLYTGNVIPAMTSNTSPSGVVSASSYYVNGSLNYPAWEAFDHIGSSYNGWVSADTNYGWLAYEFSDAKCITKYTLTPRNVNPVDYTIVLQQLPKNWTFEAWNEQLNQWVVLDTENNISDWVYTKKEFTFTNSTFYKKYRINISINNGFRHTSIGELEMMETVSSPINLTATPGDSKVQLSWGSIANATSYNVKRATTVGGPYTTIATTSTNTYIDTAALNGTTYYYVVSAVVSGVESSNSNEVPATPSAILGNKAILEITMTNGNLKEYDLTAVELDKFLTWYDNREVGIGKSYFVFTKTSNVKPFLSRKEYIAFKKISSFEVKDYND